MKSWRIRKDRDARKEWRQEEKGATEDDMVGWHHWLIGHGFEQIQETAQDREAWHVAVHVVTESQTWQSDWTSIATHVNHDFADPQMPGKGTMWGACLCVWVHSLRSMSVRLLMLLLVEVVCPFSFVFSAPLDEYTLSSHAPLWLGM